MITYEFKVDDPEDYEFYSDVSVSFQGEDAHINTMFERFEQFLLGIGYQQGSIDSYHQKKVQKNFLNIKLNMKRDDEQNESGENNS
jgi:hypothetical protein